MTLQKAAELPEPPLQEFPFQVYKTEARRRGAELLTGGEIFGFFLSFHEGEKCFSHPTKPSEGGTKETVRKYQGCLQEGDAEFPSQSIIYAPSLVLPLKWAEQRCQSSSESQGEILRFREGL